MGEVAQLCRENSVTLQTIIHGHRQSLGATERGGGHLYFKDIKKPVIDDRKRKKVEVKIVNNTHYVYDSLKFPSTSVWRLYTWGASFR